MMLNHAKIRSALDVGAEMNLEEEVVTNPTLWTVADVVQTLGYRERHGITQGSTDQRDPLQIHLYAAPPIEGGGPSRGGSTAGSNAPNSGGAPPERQKRVGGGDF